MKPSLIAAALALAFAGAVMAQTSSDSADQSASSSTSAPASDASKPNEPAQCADLTGNERDECLQRERSSASGATAAPQTSTSGNDAGDAAPSDKQSD